MPSIVAQLPAYKEEFSIGSVVLRHSRNQGKGAALKTRLGSVDGHSVIVTIDTDGQHSPDDIPRLVEPILSDVRQKDGRSFQCKGRAQEIPGYRQRRDERFLSHLKIRR